MADSTALMEVRDVSKYFGSVVALEGVSMDVHAGEVMCLLGDNGAGKSTLIKILSGVHKPSEGEFLIEDEDVDFDSPREAIDRGIATVYQDLAMIPLVGISRNFFLGNEPTKSLGPLKIFDRKTADRITHEELEKIGIEIRDPSQPVATLSGGERQSVAIARAVYFGAKVLILDEPTSALGVKEAAIVLRYMAQAKEEGLAVVFISHNVHHAYAVGDRFTVLDRGQSIGTYEKDETDIDELERLMAGGEELEQLSEELQGGSGSSKVDDPDDRSEGEATESTEHEDTSQQRET